jgi:hypothetical protein
VPSSGQKQVSGDFAPLWNVDAQVAFYPRGKQPHDAWWLVCLDTSDQAGGMARSLIRVRVPRSVTLAPRGVW